MYKRSLESLINTPPNLQRRGQRCIADFQFRKANYSYKTAPCVSNGSETIHGILKEKEMQDKETTLDGYSFDIRKLTVKEVFRLMDVDERHIDTLIGARETMKNGKERQAISNSALYRLAGNSIVVNCMTLMFENLFYPDTEPTTGDQLKLF